MIGDKIVPEEHHTGAAKALHALLTGRGMANPCVITIAGESGAGKSEIAHELARFLEADGLRVFVFGQDDYFHLPPKTNERARREDITHVGMGEVNLSLMDEQVGIARGQSTSELVKPLVVFDEDRISEEKINPRDYDVFIAEGTYVTSLDNANYRVFIDRDYHATLAHRKKRARDTIDAFINEVLEIEHAIISKHKSRADYVVEDDYSVTDVRG